MPTKLKSFLNTNIQYFWAMMVLEKNNNFFISSTYSLPLSYRLKKKSNRQSLRRQRSNLGCNFGSFCHQFPKNKSFPKKTTCHFSKFTALTQHTKFQEILVHGCWGRAVINRWTNILTNEETTSHCLPAPHHITR